ncbi:MAG: magnesium transporter CorA family protein [Candidatus Eremiobacteraeota bacterium]|nr:magnesium transporter CorA family protein [Candidatus Eremiobacteraeota bacterium]
MHCVAFREGKRTEALHDLGQLPAAIAEHGQLVWLDLLDPSAADLATLQKTFDLHPLAIEDAQTVHERPKIEQYPHYLFLIVHPVTWIDDRLTIHELAIFAGGRFLITIRRKPEYAIEEAERRWSIHDGEIGKDSGFLLYTLLDTVVDGYFPIGDRLEERIEDLENELFDAQTDQRKLNQMLRQIFDLKNDVHHARRAVVPMRDLLQPLVRGDFKIFEREQERYYRDVYDHVIRVIDQLDSARDLVSSALEIHLSLVGNRQNEVSKQLAIIATIFLPLSYLTGFFGQNFGYLVNGITSAHAFVYFGIGSEVACVVILLAYFRAKKWF